MGYTENGARERQAKGACELDLVRKRWVGAWVELVVRSGPVGMGMGCDGVGDWRKGVGVVATGSIRFETGRWVIRCAILENFGGDKLDMVQFYRGHSLSRGEEKIQRRREEKE
jgi:hypothetical protein